MMINLPVYMVICLGATIIIELIVALILGIRKIKDIINIILVNCVTNPLVVSIPFYINLFYGSKYRRFSFIIMEICTVLFEGFVYKKVLNYKQIQSYLLSLILNCSSYFIGIGINFLITGILSF